MAAPVTKGDCAHDGCATCIGLLRLRARFLHDTVWITMAGLILLLGLVNGRLDLFVGGHMAVFVWETGVGSLWRPSTDPMEISTTYRGPLDRESDGASGHAAVLFVVRVITIRRRPGPPLRRRRHGGSRRVYSRMHGLA